MASAIRRYGIAVVSVALALLPALLLQHYRFPHGELSLFLLAVALTSWFAGVGPAALSIVLSTLCYDYFFLPPIHSFAFTVADIPGIVLLICFAVLITRFSAVRRRTERQLLQARDELQADIDERKKAEEKLRRSETYLAEAQRLSNTGSWAWSPVTRRSLYWSEEMFRIFGLGPEPGPPPADAFWERVHPEDRDSMYEVLRKAVHGKKKYSHEHRIVLADGTVKHLHAIGHPLLDAAGAVVEYIGTLVDVTESKRAEQARQELEEQWRSAFESNPTMYFIVDAAGEIVSVNPFGAEQLGYSVSELVGQPVSSVFYEPDKNAVQKHAKECFEQPGRMMRWEARKIRKDGIMIWVRETANVVVLKKRPVLLVACENITEQKRAEEAVRRSEKQLRDLIETIPTMVFSIGPDGSTDFVSRNWQDYAGLSLENTTGSGWEATVHPDDLDTHLNKWRASMASGQPFENEVRHRSARGEYRWFLVRAVPLRDEQGSILKWYGILTDIEDRKRAEALLTGEKRILEMAAKGDALAQVLDCLCRLVEEQASGVLASILLLDGDRLRHGGAPSLPRAYTEAIDGVVIGPSVGSCGTAAYRKEQVIVEDIATDPLWADYREAALPHSLRACWSTPVLSSQGEVIATFAMYYRAPRSPSPQDQEIIEQITHLAGVAIERRQTQEALQRSESYLAEAQKLTKTGSLAWEPDNAKTLHCSDEVFRMFGLDPQKGMPAIAELLERVHPEDREYVRGRSRKGTDDTGEPVVDYRVVLPDGVVKYIHSIRHPVLNDSGKVVEFMGTLIDVTEQIRAEEALRRSEAYLSEAERLTHTGSWAWDPVTDKVVYCSDEFYRIFCLDRRDSAPSIEIFMQRIHPEDVGRVRAEMAMGIRAEAEQLIEIGFRLLLPDGTVKHLVSTWHRVFHRAGALLEVIGSTVDVTERKRAEKELRENEQRLRAIFDNEPECVKVVGADGSLLEMNAAGLKMIEAETLEQVRNSCVYSLIAEDHRPAFRQLHERVLRGESGTLEFQILGLNGGRRWMETHASPLRDEAGSPIAALGVTRDITERKRAEAERERLSQLEADLARMNRVSMMGELAASLAHEIKQPIAAAATNAKTSLRWLNRETPDMGEAREAISRIVKDVNRAADIIDRNRALYRRGTPKREMVSLNKLIQEMIALLHDGADRHSISIRAELDGSLPPITGDQVQMQQVLMNLMLNGIEAMNDTGGELTIRSRKNEDGGILLTVSDLGIGLPLEDAERIFDAFFSTKVQGTGMGLSISRRIIESHGGRLWAAGNAGRGSTFYFTLPAEVKTVETTLERT